jgi:hypothetical protein
VAVVAGDDAGLFETVEGAPYGSWIPAGHGGDAGD